MKRMIDPDILIIAGVLGFFAASIWLAWQLVPDDGHEGARGIVLALIIGCGFGALALWSRMSPKRDRGRPKP